MEWAKTVVRRDETSNIQGLEFGVTYIRDLTVCVFQIPAVDPLYVLHVLLSYSLWNYGRGIVIVM